MQVSINVTYVNFLICSPGQFSALKCETEWASEENSGCQSHLSGSAQLQLHQGNRATVGCAPPAGCRLEVHPPGEAPEAGLPAALGQQALPHPRSLALPEAREGGGLFGSHPAGALPPGLRCEEGLQLGGVHVCCGDGLREEEEEEEDQQLYTTVRIYS